MSKVDESWNKVLDSKRITRSIARIAHEIIEKNAGAKNVAIVGIRTRGEPIAKRIAAKIKEVEDYEVPMGVVDITLYRDDIAHSAEQPLVRSTDLPFSIGSVHIVLVDDVLYTGRTVRAALDAITDFGRPKSVQLAVLCDRGHRELPIRADYIGKSVPTERSQSVHVLLSETDEAEGVFIEEGTGRR